MYIVQVSSSNAQSSIQKSRRLNNSDKRHVRSDQSLQVRSLTLDNRHLLILLILLIRSAISTDTPGRVDKPSVLHALQSSGESYDHARETLKHVNVDASGKVELDDWVEVCSAPYLQVCYGSRHIQLNVKLRVRRRRHLFYPRERARSLSKARMPTSVIR